MNEVNNMTLQEIDAEAAGLPSEIETARATLAALEAVNDQSKTGLDVHARANSKVAMLQARLAALKAGRPVAELEEAKARYTESRAALAAATEEANKATASACDLLTPIMDPRALHDAIEGTLAVSAATAKQRRVMQENVSAGQRVLDVARTHNLERPRLKDL